MELMKKIFGFNFFLSLLLFLLAVACTESSTETQNENLETETAQILLQQLNDGEAFIWYLNHCGYAVKTRTKLLVFDYWRNAIPPDFQSLSNGWINTEEINGLDVYVFVTHAHTDHYDNIIYEWEEEISNITYIFGWQASNEPSHYCLVGPRAELDINGLQISTINCNYADIPEVAYMIEVDGMKLYFSGDYIGEYETDYEYLFTRHGEADLAFLAIPNTEPLSQHFYAFVNKFNPQILFPMHHGDREHVYVEIANILKQTYPDLQIETPGLRGERFFVSFD